MTVKCVSWGKCEEDCPHKIEHERNARCVICKEIELLDSSKILPCERGLNGETR